MVLTLLQLFKIIEAGKQARETVSIIGVIPIIPLDRFLDACHNLKRAYRALIGRQIKKTNLLNRRSHRRVPEEGSIRLNVQIVLN